LRVPGECSQGRLPGGVLADNSFTHPVVVGSSAGGIGVLSGMNSSLPEDFDAPIVVAQHPDPNRGRYLQEIPARESPLPEKTVTEHEPTRRPPSETGSAASRTTGWPTRAQYGYFSRFEVGEG
jgi:hypothetical protein